MPRRKSTKLPKVRRMKKSIKDYKSEAQYIRAFYLRNKKYIDSNISPEWTVDLGNTPYEAFKNLVLEQQSYTNPRTGNKYTVQEAIKRELRSKDLHKDWEAVDVYAHNFLEKIKSLPELKKAIIEKTDKKNIKKYEKRVWKNYIDETGEKIKVPYMQTISQLKENFNAYQVYFEGYFSVLGTNALIYRYNDVYIIEYKSPKEGAGATFDTLTDADFNSRLGKDIIRLKYRKRGDF